MKPCRLTVDGVGADVVVQHLSRAEEFEEHAMTIVHRVRPQPLEAACQLVGFESRIKRIDAEALVARDGAFLEVAWQSAKGAFKVRGETDAVNAVEGRVQDMSSFKECTDRVLPRRWARRPASTHSTTSRTVSRRFARWEASKFPTSIAPHGMRMISASFVTATVGSRAAIGTSTRHHDLPSTASVA